MKGHVELFVLKDKEELSTFVTGGSELLDECFVRTNGMWLCCSLDCKEGFKGGLCITSMYKIDPQFNDTYVSNLND